MWYAELLGIPELCLLAVAFVVKALSHRHWNFLDHLCVKHEAVGDTFSYLCSPIDKRKPRLWLWHAHQTDPVFLTLLALLSSIPFFLSTSDAFSHFWRDIGQANFYETKNAASWRWKIGFRCGVLYILGLSIILLKCRVIFLSLEHIKVQLFKLFWNES